MSPSITPHPPSGDIALPERLEAVTPYLVSLFRIVVALLFFCHGASTVFGWFGGAMGSGHAMDAGTWPEWYAGLIQVVCGALVLLGIGARSAAFLSSGSMAYAYFTQHEPHALLPLQNGGELPVVFCWGMLLIVFAGPGPWAIDRFLHSARQSAEETAGAESRQPTAV
jgi:putative oxidoreductase